MHEFAPQNVQPTLKETQIQTLKSLTNFQQRALLLKSLGLKKSNIAQEFSVIDSFKGFQFSSSQVSSLLYAGYASLKTKNIVEIRNIIKAAYPEEYKKELEQRQLTEIREHLFTSDETKKLLLIGCGLEIEEISREIKIPSANLKMRFSKTLYPKLGVHSLSEAGKVVRRHLTKEVKDEVLKRNRLLIGENTFDETETKIMLMVTLGFTSDEISKKKGFEDLNPDAIRARLSSTIYSKLGIKLGISSGIELKKIMIENYPMLIKQECEKLGLFFINSVVFDRNESEIMSLALSGKTISEIAQELNISNGALRVRLSQSIYKKLKVLTFKEMVELLKVKKIEQFRLS